MKSNIVRFPNRKPHVAYSRIDRAQDAENRAMGGTHKLEWWHLGLAAVYGGVLASLVWALLT